jgi:hypothetical protein
LHLCLSYGEQQPFSPRELGIEGEEGMGLIPCELSLGRGVELACQLRRPLQEVERLALAAE